MTNLEFLLVAGFLAVCWYRIGSWLSDKGYRWAKWGI